MVVTTGDISELLGGKIEGDPNLEIIGPSKIEEGGKGTITFLANLKYEPYIYSTSATAIIIPEGLALITEVEGCIIRVKDVYASLGILLGIFTYEEEIARTISEKSSIDGSATLGKNVNIGDFSVIKKNVTIGNNVVIHDQVYIGDYVKIGDGVTLYPGVKIYHHCIIEDNSIIHSNAVIGSDGFGYSRENNEHFMKIPQIGNVVIEKNVEVGACTTIDRATMGSTVVKEGVKLDNLVQVGHNVKIGKNTAIAAQAGVGGSTSIGENCMVGGQAGFIGHIKVADNTIVQAQSGVAGNVSEKGRKLYGYPAIDYQQYLKAYAYFKKLPEIVGRIREMENNLDKINRK